VSDGADALAASAGTLAGGAAKVATGSEQVATGVGQSEEGAVSTAQAAGQLAGGADQLASGADQLASGADQLASGTKQLADGLDKGATSVPSYTDSQRKTLTDVATTPVGLTATSQHQATVAAGLVPAVLAVALWLGTLMMFLTGGAVPSGPAWVQASAARRVLWGWLPALLVGVLQTAMLVGLIALVGVPIHSTGGLAAFCALGAIAFAATNQALISLFGGLGRLASLALVLIAAAAIGGLIPIQTAPALLQALNGILPVPQFVDGAGQLMLGGISKGLIGASVALIAWTAGALVVSVLATARRSPQLAAGPLPEPARPAAHAQPATT
jgi:putative membrane protein